MKQHKNKKCRIFTNPAFLFLYLFFLKKQRKRGLRLIYHLTFLRTCCKDTAFSCNAKLFCHFFFVNREFYTKNPLFLYFFVLCGQKIRQNGPFLGLFCLFCLDAFVLCPITMKVVSDNKHSSDRNMYYFFYSYENHH